MSYIQFKGINKSFAHNHVLSNINLSVEQGKLVTLLGPSGCGKSTLLRCLSGLEIVDSGKIYLEDTDITNLSPRQRGIGMVFQQYSLFPNLTVEQNISFGLKMKKMEKKAINSKVTQVLEITGLTEKRQQYPKQLSGGQQQRVALARAIVMEPKVLIMDEPLSSIDALLRHNLQVEIRRIQKALNITTIFVTHDQDEAMIMSDTIHLMNMGTIEQSGTPMDIYTKPVSKFAATFIGHYNIVSAAKFSLAARETINAKDVIIRPELIKISHEPHNHPESYRLKGIVRECIPQGNIIRYTLDCGPVILNADVLFTSSLFFNEGTALHIQLKKQDCLFLNG